MLIDTHTHLYLPEFDDDNKGVEAVDRAINAGVGIMVFPNVDLTTIEPMKSLAAKFPQNIRMAMGLHPTEVKENWLQTLAPINLEIDRNRDKYVAIGEVGIDLYWDKTFEQEQMLALREQISKAINLDLPVILHCREGLSQTLEVLQEFPAARAVFHSFGGTSEDVDNIRRIGDFYFGINGIVTFKNCKVRNLLPQIGIDRILLETDAPYLAPVPHRGHRNESAFIIHTAHHIAASMQLPIEEIEERTSANAVSFFAL